MPSKKNSLSLSLILVLCLIAVGCQHKSILEPELDSGSQMPAVYQEDLSTVPYASATFGCSSCISGCEAAKAFDGNVSTLWQSQNSSPQWVNINFGTPRDFNRIKIFWGSSFAKNFTVNISMDGINWTPVYSGKATAYGWQTITLSQTMKWTRIVGIYCLDRAKNWGNQIIEIKIINASYYSYSTDSSGKKFITNPTDISMLVNKERNLTSDFVPPDLVVPNVPFLYAEYMEKKNLRKEAASALERLFSAAKSAGYTLLAVSGYRSYATQQYNFDSKVQRYGSEEVANQYCARPGQSEHQSGLAMDVSCYSQGGYLTEDFGTTPEGIWLANNVHNFGFIIRYLPGKESVTGYNYEPWHVRYMGVDHAKAVKASGLCLEQYLQQIAQ